MEDGPLLTRANAENRSYHLPWVEPFTDQAGFEAWFHRSLSGRHMNLVAIHAESGQIVGVLNLNEIVAGSFQCAYLGDYGMEAFARAGFMTEAVGLAVRFAFDEIGLHRLEANIQPGNTRSIALVKRLGFRLEGFSPRYLGVAGEWRDHERWAILAD
jgi:ribosomal-protein-alanine N-acetyltransferase